MAKKTLRFNIDEDHSGFEKVSVKPTNIFELEDDINNIIDFSLFTNDELSNILKNNKLSDDKKQLINKLLSSRE